MTSRFGAALMALALVLALAARPATAAPAPHTRVVVNLDPGWRFHLGDIASNQDAAAPDYDDGGWSRIGLPHSFSIPYFQAKSFYVGYGWYRRHLRLDGPIAGRRFSLEFDGAFQDAQVFVNGRPVGRHQGGYVGFSLDVTDAVHAGDNVVAVRLNNLWNPELAPRAGEHTFSGGLYRDVRLVETAPLHVTWYGTFVTTPGVSAAASRVAIKTEIRNDTDAAQAFDLTTEILDPDGKRVARARSALSLGAGQTLTADQTTPVIPRPRLWSPDHPWLYHAVSRISVGGRTVDDFTTPFGFRWFKWTAERGFFLNGRHLYLRGVNAHQDHAGWGDAVTDAGFARDIGLIKAAGFNFVRGSHYPHAPAFADAADAKGVLFWSENNFWGTGGFDSPWGSSAYPPEAEHQAGFEASVKASLAAMIRINRNHPSIVVWSMDNEVFFTDPATLPKVRTLLSALVAETHDLDPTRPAAIGGAQRGDIDKLGDVAGYNGDGAFLFIDPGLPNMVSEYGSTMQLRPGAFDPGWGDLPHGPGQDSAKPYPWRYPWRSGEALWAGFDHGTIAGRPFGDMGMIDYYRLPKRQYYWYRQAYAGVAPPPWPQPGVAAGLRLTADKPSFQAGGTDDTQLIATVVDAAGRAISNSPPVTLTVISGPGEFPTGRAISFDPAGDIAIRDGQAAIEFRAYQSGPIVVEATSPGLAPARISLSAVGGPVFVAGVTPIVAARPYLVTPPAAAATTSLTYGRNNPTLASSQAPGHPPNLANDGDPATCWRPAAGDKAPWFILHLERIVRLSQLRLVFDGPGAHPYQVEASTDGQVWRPVDRPSGPSRVDATRIDDLAPLTAEALRLTLAPQGDGTTGLCEIEVVGSP
jgi:hypothetical protein